jgi:hypothetical protein
MAQRSDLLDLAQLPAAQHQSLTDVLGRLPSTKITQIQELLPAHWKPPSANTS